MNVTVNDLQLSIRTTHILTGVSLEAHSKQFVGVIGPNGSGKSTLLKCIYRTLEPTAGEIFLDGKSLSTIKVRESAKKLAVVAQQNSHDFEFSVLEVVLMGRAPHKKLLERDDAKDYEIVHDALKTVGMDEFSGRSFSTLSGGEQQRVLLARALAQQTECLILDEPTNHLDITHQLELLKLVKQLDITVIAAIHDLNIAAMFCDYLYVVKDGNILTQGATEDVLTPEVIREIYAVEAEIVRDSRGKMHILFVE